MGWYGYWNGVLEFGVWKLTIGIWKSVKNWKHTGSCNAELGSAVGYNGDSGGSSGGGSSGSASGDAGAGAGTGAGAGGGGGGVSSGRYSREHFRREQGRSAARVKISARFPRILPIVLLF